MRLTRTNRIFRQSPSVVIGAKPLQLSDSLTDPDHSTSYTAQGDRLRVSFGALGSTNYVAVSGQNVASSNSATGTVVVRDTTTAIASATISRNNNLVFQFPTRSFTDLSIEFESIDGAINTTGPTVSYIAAGLLLSVPNGGEVAGYNRQWLTRGRKVRTQSNKNASPTAALYDNQPLRGNLSLPNMATDFVRDDWQEFLDFSETQPFFILEEDATPESAYICFEPTYQAPQAHPGTRQSQNASLQFKAYNGL